jgi:hypothetical protein
VIRWLRYRKLLRVRAERLVRAKAAAVIQARQRLWQAYIDAPTYAEARYCLQLLMQADA